MSRFDQRQGFLVSATVHLILLTLLSSRELLGPPKKHAGGEAAQPAVARVMFPPAEVLRQLIPKSARPPATQARPAPAPVPPPEPPQAKAKDKISIGAPSTERAKGPLELRREDDLTAVPKGRPNAVPTPPPAEPPVSTAEASKEAGSADPNTPGSPGLRLPPGLGRLDRGDDGARNRPGDRGPSIASSLRNLERRLQEAGPAGLPTGTGQQMGPLFFDPEGADFTVWINHFKNEVYRNWIVPQPALMGFRGHVDIEFTVERDGRMSGLRMLKSSGTPALDRAAMNALQGSLLMRLPADYAPPHITMQVTFFYNEGPRES